jgi:hypothetical protein
MSIHVVRDRYGLLVGLLALGLLANTEAADRTTQPFPGVRYVHRHVSTPREIDMHVVIVDLKQPGVTMKTSGPNGDRPGECDLETTRAFVERGGAQIGIDNTVTID